MPTRLLEAGTPEWRPIQWVLGIEAIGLTLCWVYISQGKGWLRQAAFPICFFFVAIPWPTPVEAPIIQTLTRANASIVIEVMGALGVPAMQHGNVIVVATGPVGITDACSGIRSFQSSMMIALFLGEFYRLSVLRRLLFVPGGMLLAFAFNVGRTSFLTWVAAHKGVAAIEKYHDPAGFSIAVACGLVLWGAAVAMSAGRWRKDAVLSTTSSSAPRHPPPPSVLRPPPFDLSAPSSLLTRLSLGLLLWLAVVEVGVQVWYGSREAQIKPGPHWSMELPRGNPTFKSQPISPDTQYLLRCDRGEQGTWQEADATEWWGASFTWLPGRVAGYLAKRHTPEICLPAAGCTLLSGPELMLLNIHGVGLPVRRYLFDNQGRPLYVFHCRWEAGVEADNYVVHESARYNLVRAIWAGRGKLGQRVFEFIVSGPQDPERAKQALIAQLEKLLKVEKPDKGYGTTGRRDSNLRSRTVVPFSLSPLAP